MDDDRLRIGQAATLLRVSVHTLRRWEEEGRLHLDRSAGGQRLVPLSEVQRILVEQGAVRSPIGVSSARNQLPAIVTGVTRGGASALVEMQAGPHRLAALITPASVDELELAPGREVLAIVKATSVMVALPEA